jgi:protein TonB
VSRLGAAVALSVAVHAGVAAAVLSSRSAEPPPALYVDLTRETARTPDGTGGASAGPRTSGGGDATPVRSRRPNGDRRSPNPARARATPPASPASAPGGPGAPPSSERPAPSPAREAAGGASGSEASADARHEPRQAATPGAAGVSRPAEVTPVERDVLAAEATALDRHAPASGPDALPAELRQAPAAGSTPPGATPQALANSPNGTGWRPRPQETTGPGGPGPFARFPLRPSAGAASGSGEVGAGGDGDPRADAADHEREPTIGASGSARSAPGGGADEALRYTAYLERWRDRIQGALRYPAAARRRGLAGTVHLEITVDPRGRLREARVVQSSPHPILDEAALESVRGLGPEPFPPGLPPRTLRVRLPVVFALR